MATQRSMRLMLVLILLLLGIEIRAMGLTRKEEEHYPHLMEQRRHQQADDDQLINIIIGIQQKKKNRSIQRQLHKSHLMLSRMIKNLLKFKEISQGAVLDLSNTPLSPTGWDNMAVLLKYAFNDEVIKAENYIYRLRNKMRIVEILNAISYLDIEKLNNPAINAMVCHVKNNYNNAYIDGLNVEWHISIVKKLLPTRFSLAKDITTLANLLSISWSPDSRFIALTACNGMVYTCDNESEEVVHAVKSHASGVRRTEWSPNSRLITAMAGKDIHIWDNASGTLSQKLKDELSVVEWSPNGRYIASGSYGGMICVWDSVTGALLQQLHSKTGNLQSSLVAWSPNNKFIASGHGNKLRVWKVIPANYTLSETAVILKILAGESLKKDLTIDKLTINEQELYDDLDDGTKAWLRELK